jgi:hypothetical protein
MPFIGNQPAEAYSSFQKQDFTTSATTSYTLDHPVANGNEIALFINFVRQEPTAAYTASGTSLTLTSATSSSDDMYCVYLGKAVQTVNPPNSSVGNSQLDVSAINSQTAETSIAGGDEVLIYDTSASALRKMTRTNFVSGVGGNNTPAFSARIGSNQTLSDNTDTKVNFDTEDFDTDSAYDTTNKRFTVPTGEGGKYFLYTRGRFLKTNMSQYVIAFRVNGAEVAKRYIYSGGVSTYIFNAIQYFSFDISAVETLSAGDYVEVYVKGDNVDGQTITFENGTIQSEFSGYKLIGV